MLRSLNSSSWVQACDVLSSLKQPTVTYATARNSVSNLECNPKNELQQVQQQITKSVAAQAQTQAHAVQGNCEFVVGVDEAGKGCVLGPMCIAALVWRRSQLHLLSDWEISDSKKLTAKNRKTMRAKMMPVAVHTSLVSCPAQQLNDWKRQGVNLNQMGVRLFARALDNIPSDKVPEFDLYLDAADVIAQRFGEHVLQHVKPETRARIRTVVSEHKADGKYRVVGGASIFAKELREEWVEEMNSHPETGFGDGYCNIRSKTWLTAYYSRTGKWPDFCRTFYKTCDDIVAELQKKASVSLPTTAVQSPPPILGSLASKCADKDDRSIAFDDTKRKQTAKQRSLEAFQRYKRQKTDNESK